MNQHNLIKLLDSKRNIQVVEDLPLTSLPFHSGNLAALLQKLQSFNSSMLRMFY